MIFNTSQYSDVIVYNSITNTLADEKFDSTKPFSFIEFLNFSKLLTNGIVEFSDYQAYLKKWNEVTLVRYNDINAVIKEEFIALLKTIVLDYSTVEEKKFFDNIDYENQQDLEIVAPFFATKIKQVLLYFAEKRDSYVIDLELAKNKGSIFGINNYIRNTILETIFANDIAPQITTTQPLSVISADLKIEIEEGYDVYNNYFDLDPFAPPEYYNANGLREKYFTSNTNTIDKYIFLDYERAIIDLINSERVVLNTLQSLVVNVDTPNLNLLQDYDFINYDERTRSNLKLILNAELVKKFTGTDFYYLSTNSTGAVLSGLLFEASSPVLNILNVNSPSTLTVPQSSTLYERDVGLFFKPTLQSILQLQTPFNYEMKSNVLSGHVYIFPDPQSYGNIVGISKSDHETPFNFIQQGNEIQRNISSNNALGNSFVTKNDFTFESYHSLEQNSVQGVAQELYNAGVVSSYVSDIFGNVYIGFKQQNTNYIKNFANNVSKNISMFGLSSTSDVQYLNTIVTVLTSGTFLGTSSVEYSSLTAAPTTIYSTRNSPGTFFVYNVYNNSLSAMTVELANIFTKLETECPEINNCIYNFEVYGSTFVITTSAHLIIDKLLYDTGLFSESLNAPLLLANTTNNKSSNVFLVNDQLYVAQVNVSTSSVITSGYNTREYNLSLYSFDTINHKIAEYAFANSTDNTFSYQFNTLVNVTNINLIYNKKQELFNVVITYKDNNNNIFFHSLFLRISNGVVSLVTQKIFQNTNTNFTINFSQSYLTSSLVLNSLSSTPVISIANGYITL